MLAHEKSKMSPKRRTDLKIWQSKAKNLEELDFDVRKSLAPPKSIKNDEKLNSKIMKNSEFVFRFFYVFGTAKGRSRLKFWRRVVLDVPVRPKILQNKIFWRIFAKTCAKTFAIAASAGRAERKIRRTAVGAQACQSNMF